MHQCVKSFEGKSNIAIGTLVGFFKGQKREKIKEKF
jgi:hypothetical protein